MPNRPKCFIRGTVVEVTFRTEEGLPLIAAAYMRVILEGILARAQSLYPVTICHLLVMANHMHMILVVQDPEVVKDFVGSVKRESAHAINRLMGRRKRTIWCDGYDSCIILDAEKVIERIVHLYGNPSAANLVENIDEYPNIHTWSAFLRGGSEAEVKRIPRNSIFRLSNYSLTLTEQRRIARELLDEGVPAGALQIDSDAWLNCFKDTEDADPNVFKQLVIEKLRRHEADCKNHRGAPVMGAMQLLLQPINIAHTPKKFGLRMICLSTSRNLRARFISWFSDQCQTSREALARWRDGNFVFKPPPGFFAPGGFLYANILPSAIL